MGLCDGRDHSISVRPRCLPKRVNLPTKRFTLNLENADLRYALKLLFTSAGANYTLDQAFKGP